MISLVITIAILGLIVWLVVTYVPMPPMFRNAILVTAIVCIVLYLLSAFGLWHGTSDVPVPQLRQP